MVTWVKLDSVSALLPPAPVKYDIRVLVDIVFRVQELHQSAPGEKIEIEQLLTRHYRPCVGALQCGCGPDWHLSGSLQTLVGLHGDVITY